MAIEQGKLRRRAATLNHRTSPDARAGLYEPDGKRPDWDAMSGELSGLYYRRIIKPATPRGAGREEQ